MIRLLVRSGPQAGAAESVPTGEWLLGSGEHCDLVLRDTGIRIEQLTLLVSAMRVCTRTVPLAQAERSGSEHTTVVEKNWSAGETLRLGDTDLVWEPEAAPETLDNNPPRRTRGFLERQGASRSERYTQWALGSLAAMLLAGVLVAQASRASADAALPALRLDSATGAAREALIATRLQSQDFPEVSVQRRKDGSEAVVGWVRDGMELRRLQGHLSGLVVEMHIVEADEQVRFAREYLSTSGLGATVRYQGDGVLMIEASGTDESGFRERLRGLQEAAPQVRRFELDYHVHSMAKDASLPTVPPLPAPPRQVISGIDGVSLFGPRRFMTAGTHYVFEGGVLRDGSSVQAISTDLIALTPNPNAGKEIRHDISRLRRD